MKCTGTDRHCHWLSVAHGCTRIPVFVVEVRITCPRTAAMRAAAFQRAASVAGPHGAAVAALCAIIDYVPDGAARAAARLL
eukprot:100770-Prymnesium_polylepis.1